MPANEKPSVFLPNENPPPDPKSAKLARFLDADKSIPLLRFSGFVTVPPKMPVAGVVSFGFEPPPNMLEVVPEEVLCPNIPEVGAAAAQKNVKSKIFKGKNKKMLKLQ